MSLRRLVPAARRTTILLCAMAMLPTGVMPLAGQGWSQRLSIYADDSSTFHPAALALREWRRLELTREQVAQIRDIQEQLLESFGTYLEAFQSEDEPPDPAIWWGERELDEEALRRSYHELADRHLTLTLRVLELGRDVYELLDGEQSELLKRLQREEGSRPGEQPVSERPRPCLGGNQSGGGHVTPRTRVVYSVSFERDTARLGIVWVGRPEERFYGFPPAPEPPVIPGAPESLGGASMESWMLRYDRETHRAWLDTMRIDLGTDNVILLHGVDRMHDLVVGR